ncbi:MAG: DUF4197 domain-containing protein [Lysobacteraceae bacterium]
MRRSSVLALIVCLTVAGGAGAQSLERQLKDRLLGGNSSGSAAGLSEKDAAGGVREALAQGVDRAVRQLGAPDGFFRDEAVKILVPQRLRKVADLARQLGAGKKVDAFELSMNRAAEKAVPLAAGIIADSVRKMTLQDAIGLVRGGDTSATEFFRRTSEEKLYAAFLPIVQKQTASVGVTQKYKDVSKKAGGNALAGALLGDQGMNGADLDDYVTRRTIDGLFHVIAEQERRIRRDPGARTTDLLRRVFR